MHVLIYQHNIIIILYQSYFAPPMHVIDLIIKTHGRAAKKDTGNTSVLFTRTEN